MSISKQSATERLASEFVQAAGRPLLSVQQAAEVVGVHASSVRRAIWRGELRCSRRSANGPIRIRAGELARWIVEGERLSFPGTA